MQLLKTKINWKNQLNGLIQYVVKKTR